MPPWAPAVPHTADPDGPIVVISDTQRTSVWEHVFLLREQNDDERRALIAKLARDERPAFVVHLGDLVVDGGDPESWQYFDRLVSPLTVRGIRILPTLGNHDYWGNHAIGLREAVRRFPELGQGTYYWMKHGNLALVWLNSNLEKCAAVRQEQWFESVLGGIDRDDSIRGVLVFTHHPPYTNGVDRHADEYVSSKLLPLFMGHEKAVAMLSGHVHGYERFVVNGRTFVVTGGGGGPRVGYHVGYRANPTPAYVTASGALRPFNYVVIENGDNELKFTTKCLNPDDIDEPCTLETFRVALPLVQISSPPAAPALPVEPSRGCPRY